LALGIAGVALGNARGALDAFKRLASTKRSPGGKRTIAERGYTQIELAKAEATLRAARAFLFDEIESAWRAAETGAPMGVETRARLRLAATHAARACADVTRVMYDLAGGTAVYLDNGLQRRFRDGHVATQHIMVQASTYELIGRALFGQSLDVSTL
jgi:alkylation response protein AidB-like acyl-CoA dehydrogenase